MKKKQMFMVAAAVVLLGVVSPAAYCDLPLGAAGTATLGQDKRPGMADPPNFGFAFMHGPGGEGDPVLKGQPYKDTCKTLDSQSKDTLTAIDGVASPENAEIVYNQIDGTSTVTFYGRTCECYYMVTGIYTGGTGGSGGSGTSPWYSDFDTNNQDPTLTSPHFIVYIEEEYASGDDYFSMCETSKVTVELRNAGGLVFPVNFTLSQVSLDPAGTGAVQLQDRSADDPNAVVYTPYTILQINGIGDKFVLYAEGTVSGIVSIIASDGGNNVMQQ